MKTSGQGQSRLRHALTPELRLARQATVFGYVTLAVAAVLGLPALLFKVLDRSEIFPLWVIPVALVLVVVGLICGFMGKAAEWRERRERAAREWNDLATSLLRLPVRDGRLPRLEEASDAELGATITRYSSAGADAYVPRPEADENLRTALRCTGPPFPFVLLHGNSKAGKSRTMTEAARSEQPRALLIVPKDGQAAAILSRLDPPLTTDVSPALVWLDDLPIAGLDHLTSAVLHAWADRAIVVATMTTKRYRDVLSTGSEVGVTARAALNGAIVIELPFELSEEEQRVAQQTYPAERINTDDGRPVSIGEVLIGGEELVRKLRAGREDCPAGLAVARAAIDARRAGLSRPISNDELRHLFPLYLRQVNAAVAPTTEEFAIGVEWAAMPVASQVAILREAFDQRWEVLDYVVEAEAGAHNHPQRSIPDFLWPELLITTSSDDALAIGIAANRANQHEIARNALRRAEDSPRSGPIAGYFLGAILEGLGDEIGAREAYQRVIDSRDPDYSLRAKLNLGAFLRRRGDTRGAEDLFGQVLDSSSALHEPIAAYELGHLLKERGDLAGAETAYRRAAKSGHSDYGPTAMLELGILLHQRGDTSEAEATFRNAVESESQDIWPVATLNLGILLDERGDISSAEKLYRVSIESNNRKVAPRAAFQLAQLLSNRGEGASHQRALQLAVELGGDDFAPTLAFDVGERLEASDDVESAEKAYRLALHSGHPDVAPKAAFRLAALLRAKGDLTEARAMYQQVVKYGHADMATKALQQLEKPADSDESTPE